MKHKKPGIKIIRRVEIWQCNVCKTQYEFKRSAEKCALMPTEKKLYKKGDTVSNIEHYCNVTDGGVRCLGTIIKARLDSPPDEDWSARHMNGKHYNTHVWCYEVKFECRRCNGQFGREFIQDEIIALKKTEK